MADEFSGWSSVPNWVIRSNKLQGSEKLLYIALLNRANAKGECWPSLATLANDVGTSTRTVLRKLDDLESKGLVKKTRRANASIGNVSNMYRVLPFRESTPSDKLSPPGDNEHQALVTQCHHPSDNELQEVLPSEVLPSRSTTHTTRVSFDAVWELWPKKTERERAEREYVKHSQSVADLPELIARFGSAYAATTEKQFVPSLAAWLHRKRWTDELPTRRLTSSSPSKAEQAWEFVNGGEHGVSGSEAGVRGYLEQ